jgi:hypothetical protein
MCQSSAQRRRPGFADVGEIPLPTWRWKTQDRREGAARERFMGIRGLVYHIRTKLLSLEAPGALAQAKRKAHATWCPMVLRTLEIFFLNGVRW